MNLYLFQYGTEVLFSKLVYYISPIRFKYEVSSMGQFHLHIFYGGSGMQPIVEQGLYSVITEEEIELDDKKYRYHILPYVKLEHISNGFLFEALSFMSNSELFGISIACGVQVITRERVSIRDRQFPQLK